jgi:hypothetical protein
MTTATLAFTTGKDVVDHFKKAMRDAQRTYEKHPNSLWFNRMLVAQFAYQQAYYTLYSVNLLPERLQQVIDALNADDDHNDADTLCQIIWDKPVRHVMSDAGITVY